MHVRARIGDNFGRIFAEEEIELISVEWILNGISEMRMRLPKSGSALSLSALERGNRIFLEFDNGLPPWGGVVEAPVSWDRWSAEVTCYSIEYLLKTRLTAKFDAFFGEPLGQIFKKLLQRTEAEHYLGITLGTTWHGGRGHWLSYHFEPLWDILSRDFLGLEDIRFRFTPYVEGGVIYFRAELHERLGVDKTNSVWLIEDRNISETTVLESEEELVNEVFAVGAGSDWGEERLVGVARNQASIDRFGYRAKAEIFSDIADQSALLALAALRVRGLSTERHRFKLGVADVAPARFATYDLDDTIRLYLPSYRFQGFNAPVRLLGRAIDGAGHCEVVVEEETNVTTWYQTAADDTGLLDYEES